MSSQGSSKSIKDGASRVHKEAKARLKQLKENVSGGWATDKEIRSWYLFDWANSVFWTVGMGLVLPLLLVYNAEQAGCPYNKEVTYKDFNATTTCAVNGLASSSDDWITWTDRIIRKGTITNGTFNESPINCTAAPSWMIAAQRPGVNGSYYFRNKTINATEYQSTAPFSWTWTFDALLSDAEVPEFHVHLDPFMFRNVSIDVVPDAASFGNNASGTKIVRSITLNATINGWKRGFTAATVSTSPENAFTFAIKVNQTECWGVVGFFGFSIRAYTFAAFVISFSVFFQAICFVLTSALGDHKRYRKNLMVGSSLAGSFFTLCILLVSDDLDLISDRHKYKVSGFLVVVGNVCFGLSNVMYNAFLSFLALAHPQMKKETEGGKPDAEKLLATYIRVEERISNIGFAYGYFGGAACLILSVGIFLTFQDTYNLSLMLAVILTAIWWFVFTLPTVWHLEARPGPPLPKKYQGWFGWIAYGFADTWEVLVNIKTLPNTYRFIIAYWMFSDTYGTIAAVAILFANHEFELTTIWLVILSIIVPIAAGLGNYIQMMYNQKVRNTQKDMVVINLGILAILCLYAMSGIIPGNPLGLTQWWELYIIGNVFGFVMGPLQAFARCVLADLTPPGLEAEFFGAWELTDKGSSWMGPMIVGICFEAFGSLRYSFVYLFIMCIAPLILIRNYVDVDQGRKDTRSLKTMVWVKKRRAHKRKEKRKAGGRGGSSASTSKTSSSAATTNLFSQRGGGRKSTKVAPTSSYAESDNASSAQDSDSDEETNVASSAVQSEAVQSEAVESEAVESCAVEDTTTEEVAQEDD